MRALPDSQGAARVATNHQLGLPRHTRQLAEAQEGDALEVGRWEVPPGARRPAPHKQSIDTWRSEHLPPFLWDIPYVTHPCFGPTGCLSYGGGGMTHT